MFIALFNLKAKEDDPDNNVFNSVYSYFMLTVTLAVMPLAIVYVINQTQETLDDLDFLQRWGMIYKSYKRDNQLAIAFDFLFCFRRVAFVYSIFAF